MRAGDTRVLCHSLRVFLKNSRICRQLHYKFVCNTQKGIATSLNSRAYWDACIDDVYASDSKRGKQKQWHNPYSIDYVSLRIIDSSNKSTLTNMCKWHQTIRIMCARDILLSDQQETEGLLLWRVIACLEETGLIGSISIMLWGTHSF